jgi:OOP family OmpA-OmpF porin
MNVRSTLPLLLMACSLAAGGAPPDDRFSWVQGQLGFLSQENSFCVKDSLGFGLGAGRWFQPQWGYEATFLHSSLESKAGLWKASENHLDATGLYRPPLDLGRWIPFLRAGVGVSQLQNPLSLSGATTTRMNLLMGAGAQVRFGNQSLGTLELRSATIESSTRRQEFQALTGYGFRWGAAAPLRVAEPTPRPVPAVPAPVVLPPPAPVPPAPAPALVPPAPAPAPVPMPVPALAPLPTKIVLGDAVLHFANNGAELSLEGVEAIKAVAPQLKTYPGAYTLVVSGHTSSLGSSSHNHALSKRRAEAVAKLLIEAGIPADQVFTVGRGPDAPIADNKTREGQSRNRRVEIDIKTTEAVEKLHTDTGLVDVPTVPKAPSKPGKPTKNPKT